MLASAVVQPMPWRELAFLSWAGLRGAVPIVLTTIPLAEGVDDAERLFDIVFVMVVIYTLLTGPTLPLVARVLKVARRSEPRGLELEAAPLERVAADLLQVTISPVSKLHGVEVGELRLPRGASVSMVIRDGETMVPERRTVLRHGDDLLVVTPRRLRERTEERLRAGQRARPARPVARRVGGASSSSAGGLQIVTSSLAATDARPSRQAGNWSPTTTLTPGSGGSRRTTSASLPRQLATSCTAGFFGSSVQISTPATLVPSGALPSCPRRSPASTRSAWSGRPGPRGCRR